MRLGKKINYAKLDWKSRQSHERYKRYVAAHGLPCQDCGGRGGEYDYPGGIELGGMWEECGWCKGTGKVTRHVRGLWLKTKREEAQWTKTHSKKHRGIMPS